LSYGTRVGEGLEATYRIVAAILLVCTLAQTLNVFHSVEASSAYFSVDTFPNPYSASAVGEKFNVNVTVYQLSNGSGCYDAAFELSYNSTVIRVSSYTLAPLWGTDAVTDAAGTLQVDVSNPSSTPNGDVLVITIQFAVLIQGLVPVEYRSPLHLFNTRLLGNSGEILTGPPVDGLVIVTPRSPAPIAAFTWYPMNLRANQTVTFDGTGSAPGWNGTGYSPIVNYTWDFGDSNFTSGYYPTILHTYAVIGNYTVHLNVTDADGFQNTVSHVVNSRSMLIGDINGDGVVNILDAILLANSFLATPSSSNWNPNADINGDGIVNILDAIMLANHFLEHYP
jgi:hypothetical protein